MRTSELIRLLGADVAPVSANAPARKLLGGASVAAVVALALVLGWLGPRPDLAAAAAGTFFWIKAAYTAALGAAGFWAVERLSRPGAHADRPVRLGAAILMLFGLAAVGQFLALNGPGRLSALRGVSWVECTRNIAILAAPLLAAMLWVVRQLAPTRRVSAGFAAGVCAGGVAATLYGLHCPEATFVFVAVWYTLGLVVSGAVGAALGPWALRW